MKKQFIDEPCMGCGHRRVKVVRTTKRGYRVECEKCGTAFGLQTDLEPYDAGRRLGGVARATR